MRVNEEEHEYEDAEEQHIVKSSLLSKLHSALPAPKKWQASRQWSIRQDGLFSALECVKAGIGYFLYVLTPRIFLTC